MSAAAKDEGDTMMFCASCGVAGGDRIKLKRCTACYLVRYCSVKCQKDHRPKHKRECKKRAAELHDELLFKQPEGSYLGDCPICCLPLPIDAPETYCTNACCSKMICDGCDFANKWRENEMRHQQSCPFCRKAMPKTQEECDERMMKRIEANDPIAMRHVGTRRHMEGDYTAAFEYWKKLAALGDAEGHYQLGSLYHCGRGVEKDEKKELHHMEQAAIGGHPDARHNLGCLERDNGQYDRAAKHWIIAATLGLDVSLDNVKDLYEDELVSKEDFAAALRGYQTAIAATKSPLREEASKHTKWLGGFK